MDYWHPITVCAEQDDAVQRWAKLEGKSPDMREDLIRHWKPEHQRLFSNAAVLCEIAVVALKAWWQIYGS